MNNTKKVLLVKDYEITGSNGFHKAVPAGIYEVVDIANVYKVVSEGTYSGDNLPKELCLIAKEYAVEYVTDLEIKAAKTAQDLVERDKELAMASEFISNISDDLNVAIEQHPDIGLDPSEPEMSVRILSQTLSKLKEQTDRKTEMLDTVRTEVINLLSHVGYEEPDKYGNLSLFSLLRDVCNEIAGKVPSASRIHNIVDEMLSRYGITCDHSLHEKVTLLSENVRGNRSVKVPADVAKALDEHKKDFIAVEILVSYGAEMSKIFPGPELEINSVLMDYVRDQGMINFFDVIVNGYESIETPKEKWIRNMMDLLNDPHIDQKGFLSGIYEQYQVAEILKNLEGSDVN